MAVAREPRAGREEDFSRRTTARFNDGVFAVTNAVPDSVLIFRGAACVYEAFEIGFRGHDQGQTLMRDHGTRRIFDTTEPYTKSVVGVEDRPVNDVGLLKARLAGTRVVFLSELVRVTLMGEDIRLAAHRIRANLGIPSIAARSSTLIRDDSDAFRSLLDGMVEALVERERPPIEPGTVGIMGYPYLRHEGDTAGDLAEFDRLVTALGLSLKPVWLSGAGWDLLGQIAGASLIVALPDGEPAAQRLGAATGAPIVGAPIPVALGQAESWVRTLGAATGTEREAEALVERELSRVVPLVARYVRSTLLGRRAIVIATAAWLPGILRCLEEDLGMEVARAIRRNIRDPAQADADPHDPSRDFDPSELSIAHHVDEALARGGVDVIVGNAWERNVLAPRHKAIPFLEFGYPQDEVHFLAATPHLGFEGVLTWAQRLRDLLSGGRG